MTYETPSAEGFLHRLAKNARHLARYARRAGTDAYRAYDADLPEFNLAVDVYAGRVCVQEYAPPSRVDPALAAARVRDAVRAAASVFGVAESDVATKQRRRLDPGTQYRRLAHAGARIEVREGRARYLVSLTDRIDTGLYLDHRGTRELVAELAPGKKVLNLFCCTGTATVAAALAGATGSISVDLSKTSIEWAAQNFEKNGLDLAVHRLVRDDCRSFVAQLAGTRERFDLALVDPPTYSNSKSAPSDFEAQRDHAALLRAVARLLRPGGAIVFSTHARRFKLDDSLGAEFAVRDVTKRTIPEDFKRNPRIHQCWILEPRAAT